MNPGQVMINIDPANQGADSLDDLFSDEDDNEEQAAQEEGARPAANQERPNRSLNNAVTLQNNEIRRLQ